MKNLKKVLALTVVFAMMLGMVAFAAPSDVAGTDYEESVTTLGSLGILKGYEDGTFKPEGEITRAEFATVVVKAVGLGDLGKTTSSFTDVPADHWASGFITMASQLGIIAGYGNGKFGPSDNVTYEQAVKMVVAALGYTPKAEALGGYPTGYMVVAAQEGITKNASGVAGQAAKRGLVAKLVYNSLDVPLMEQTGFGKEISFEADKTKTLLSQKLKIDKYEGAITTINFDKTNADKVTFTVSELIVNSLYKINTTGAPNNPDMVIKVGNTNAKDLKYYSVVAYVDTESDDPTFVAVFPKSGKNNTMVIKKSLIDNFYVGGGSTRGQVKYFKNADDANTVNIDLASNFKAYKNADSTPQSINANSSFTAYPNGTETVTFIDNDGDSVYDYGIFNAYDTIVVDSTDKRTRLISPKTTADSFGGSTNIYLNPEADSYTFSIKDTEGNKMDFVDIKPLDVISYATSQSGAYKEVIVSRKSVSGRVNERGLDKDNQTRLYSIEGKEYKVIGDKSSNTLSTHDKLKLGDEGTFYLDSFGRIAYREKTATAGNYAFIIAVDKDVALGSNRVQVQMINSKGEVVIYNLASTVDLDDVPTKSYDSANGILSGPLNAIIFNSSIGFNTTAGYLSQLVSFSVNSSNEITKLYKNPAKVNADYREGGTAELSSKTYDERRSRVGDYYLTNNTQYFATNKSSLTTTKDDYLVTTKASFKDDETYTAEQFFYDRDKNIIAAVFTDFDAKIDKSSTPILITSVSTAKNDADDEIFVIRGLKDGVQVQYKTVAKTGTNALAKSSKEYFAANALDPKLPAATTSQQTTATSYIPEKGDLVQVALNGNDEIESIRLLYRYNDTNGDHYSLESKTKTTLPEGFLYVGKVEELSGNIVTLPIDKATGNPPTVANAVYADLYANSAVQTYYIGLTGTTIKTVDVIKTASLSSIETNERPYTSASSTPARTDNDDILVVYKFDADTVVAIIVDANRDTIVD